MNSTKTDNGLTARNSNAILNPQAPCDSEELPPQLQELAEVLGKQAAFAAAMRRGLLTMVSATEDFLGIDCRVCRHCGKPVR